MQRIGLIDLLVLAGLLLMGTVNAQNVPHYLTVTAPLLEQGVPYLSSLDESDGQNFKDGSRLEVLQIFGFAGDIVELTVSSNFDSYLIIYGANDQ